jgi:hypothetical protein
LTGVVGVAVVLQLCIVSFGSPTCSDDGEHYQYDE